MDIFRFRNALVDNYSAYVRSFFTIRDQAILAEVQRSFEQGVLWPEVLIQLNPNFRTGRLIPELVKAGELDPLCERIFRREKSPANPTGKDLRLHSHQEEALLAARRGENYVLTTGTGSGKSLSYIVPIVDHVCRHGSGRGIQAIIVYPMNALANSQLGELEKFLESGLGGARPVSYRRYTGQEDDPERQAIIDSPPDILLTNYVMLELLLTRPYEQKLIAAAKGLRFLVLDELHTYRGRQGADVALLVRRLRDRVGATDLLCIGTSATMGGSDAPGGQQAEVSRVATLIFGSEVKPSNVIGETLEPATLGGNPSANELRTAILAPDPPGPREVERFRADPLARWVEATFGMTEKNGRLVRADPLPIAGPKGAAARLAGLTGIAADQCLAAIQRTLLTGYLCEHPVTSRPLFAFRLHQFISKGGTVYASLDHGSSPFASARPLLMPHPRHLPHRSPQGPNRPRQLPHQGPHPLPLRPTRRSPAHRHPLPQPARPAAGGCAVLSPGKNRSQTMSDLIPATPPGGGEFLFYQSDDGRIRLQVRLEGESVWLTQAQLSELFQRERSVITKHVRNVFEEGELEERAVCADFARTAADGEGNPY